MAAHPGSASRLAPRWVGGWLIAMLVMLAPWPGTAWAAWTVTLDSAPAADGRREPVLVRSDASGRRDPVFGQGGSVSLDGLRPRRVLGDRLGNLLVVGATAGPSARPAVRRLTGTGHPDPAWAAMGDTPLPPEILGEVVDALLLPDGRLLLLLQLTAPERRAALWALEASGRAAPRWLLHTETLSSEALSLRNVGSLPTMVMAAVLTPRRDGRSHEGHIHDAAAFGADVPERLVRQALPRGWPARVVLERVDERWHWLDPEAREREPLPARPDDGDSEAPAWAWQQVAESAVPAGPASAARDAAPAPNPSAAATPPRFAGVPVNPIALPFETLPAPLPAAETQATPWTLWIGAGVLAVAAASLWRWRRRSHALKFRPARSRPRALDL
jgi:hypothetical protein